MNRTNIPLSKNGKKTEKIHLKNSHKAHLFSNLMMLLRQATFFTLCFFIASCGKNETETLPDLAKTYYPLQIGKTFVYNIDTIIYDPQPNNIIKIDTYRWQVKEVFVDTFRSLNGQLLYKIERSEHLRGDTLKFEVKKIFTAGLADNGALRTEDNLTFIKFPRFLGEKTIWDGNIYCDPTLIIEVAGERMGLFSKTWNYEVLTVGKSETIGSKTFDNVLTVRAQSDTRILTEKRYTLEKYAKDIGLVYKEQHILDTQKLDASIAWEKKAERGYIVQQTVVSYK